MFSHVLVELFTNDMQVLLTQINPFLRYDALFVPHFLYKFACISLVLGLGLHLVLDLDLDLRFFLQNLLVALVLYMKLF